MKTRERIDLIDDMETKALKSLDEAIEKQDTKEINNWLWIVSCVQKLQ